MPVESVAQLVRVLQQSPLLDAGQLEELTYTLQPQFTEPRELARALVQRGWLTGFQVNRIFQGRAAELLVGSYLLLERLGQGGMGQVFKARRRPLDRLVALKLLRTDRLATDEILTRFRREMEVAARLEHPNIVRALDAGEIDGTLYFAMEYLEGADLAHLVGSKGPLPVEEASDYVRQAALALQHAHERGLVHRDIKPANLFLTSRDRVVKLLDLGLARADSTVEGGTLTQTGSVVGTPDYISPEQARNSHDVDIRADLYSLGCTLYFLLTGQPPFPGGTLTEKLLKHQLDPAPRVRQLRPEVSPALDAVVYRLMAKRPPDRFATPAELVSTLDDAAQGISPVADLSTPLAIPASAPPEATAVLTFDPSAPTATVPPTRRRPPDRTRWYIAAGAAVLLLLAAGGAWLALNGSRQGPPPETRSGPPPDKPEEKKPPEPPEAERPEVKQAMAALQKWGAKIGLHEDLPHQPMKVIDLQGRNLAQADLGQLAAFRHLEQVLLAQTGVSDEAMRPIARLPRLTHVDLAGTRITDSGLAQLRELPELLHLNVALTRIDGTGLAQPGWPRLRELRVDLTSVGDNAIARWPFLPQLRVLGLTRAPVGDKALAHLRAATEMTNLDLTETRVTNAGLKHLRPLTHLNFLSLRGTQITGAGLPELAPLEEIELLDLAGIFLQNELQGLPRLPHLRELCLHLTAVTDSDLIHLKDRPSMVLVNLSETGVRGPGLVHLEGQEKLVQLDLTQTPIIEAELARLKNMPGLQTVRLTKTNVTDACLVHLKAVKYLRNLYIQGTQITDQGVRDLQTAMPQVKVYR
jgi:serine/threonine-protein kinase